MSAPGASMTDSATKTMKGTVLVVDDDDATRRLIVMGLEHVGLTCLQASDGAAALEVVRRAHHELDAVVLDVMLPRLGGFDVLAALRAVPELRELPVILVTAHADTDGDILRGMNLGAVDHIIKPFSGPILRAKVLRAVERSQADRATRAELERARQLARIDALTGLGNRLMLDERLRAELSYGQRHNIAISVVLLDLDHFKAINDTFGHIAGDAALRHFATTLSRATREEDAAFRYGGEEFMLLIRGEPSAGQAAAARLRAALSSSPIELGGEQRVLGFSAGIACQEPHSKLSPEQLLERADEALYEAKTNGRGRDVVARP
ncbi:MAG: diguanylate cyclase [Polyangiaceae bacterium]